VCLLNSFSFLLLLLGNVFFFFESLTIIYFGILTSGNLNDFTNKGVFTKYSVKRLDTCEQVEVNVHQMILGSSMGLKSGDGTNGYQ